MFVCTKCNQTKPDEDKAPIEYGHICQRCLKVYQELNSAANISKVDNAPHYRNFVIEPIEFAQKNKLDFFQGNVVKYVCRYKFKDGLKDLQKAKDYLERMIKEYDK